MDLLEKMLKEIPTVEFPSVKEYNYNDSYENEKLVSLSKLGLITKSAYYFDSKIPGSYKDCFLRESVANKLVLVNKKLQKNGLKLLVYDGYRPICVQQFLWDYYKKEVVEKNPNLSEEEINFKTSFFVSKPSLDVERPSLHNTGGAVDVTLISLNGDKLDMGTDFDDFSDKAWSNHFETFEKNIVVRDNRRILYYSMLEEGFTNLPSEWWHFDYGTKFWAYFKNEDALYKGIIDAGNIGERLCIPST